MGFYIDVLSLLSQFGTPLTVKPVKLDNETTWINGEAVNDKFDETIEISEPFLPMGQIGRYANMLQIKDIGKTEKYEMQWISAQKVGIGTIVTNKSNGKIYKVHDSDDYSDYSNAIIYYLKSENVDSESGGNDE